MSKFEDTIRALAPDMELPEGLLTNLQNAYDADINEIKGEVSTLKAVVNDRDAQLETLGNDLTKAKLKNYDLLMELPKVETPADPPADGATGDVDVDDLFETVGKDTP